MWCDVMWYDMIYLSTAVGLTPGGSSTVHIYTQTIYRTTQIKTQNGTNNNRTTQMATNLEEWGRALSLRVLPWHLPYNLGKSTETPHSFSYSVRGNIPAYFCVLLHVIQEIKLQQTKNNYVLCTRPFDVLRDMIL
jgi:hypothetical protein